MHVRCPHCHQPVELVDNAGLEHIDCPSCGSHFSLLGERTTDYRGGETPTIGHFELIERLGMGQFGTVWMARDTELDRTVAVKIPRQEQLGPGDVEMFLREARAAAQLNHPNIVSVHEVGREGDTVYIVSDLVRGVPLADRLTAGRLSPREAATLCVTIAEALHHAHQAGIVHRDLKPSNIMLDADGQPHLMDFGLAKREAAEITMTMDGRILGTPAYMSPEQARGEAHHADARSDIYSLGTILFELLTGELPFGGNKRMLLMQIIHDEPPRPRKLDAAVPRDLETICLKCLEKSPERRYATARELADELRKFLDGQPICARPLGRFQRGWRWCRRRLEGQRPAPTDSVIAAPPSFERKNSQKTTDGDLRDTAGDILAPHEPGASDDQRPSLEKIHSNVQFTVYRPKTMRPRQWYTLLAFAHLDEKPPDAPANAPAPFEEVKRQAEQILGPQLADSRQTTQDSLHAMPHAGALTFVPEITGVDFNPRQLTLSFVESVHKAEFRMWAAKETDGQVLRGGLSVFLGPILLAAVPLTIAVDSKSRRSEASEPLRAPRYRKIFASYSHCDHEIVERFEELAEALGDRYLRDCKHLRSGEEWGPRLMQMIEEADVFQLFWSRNAMRSHYCRQEWEYALSLRRDSFVRPTYWEDPMPHSKEEGLPPSALAAIHFTKIGGTAATKRTQGQVSPSATAYPESCPRAGERDTESMLAAPPRCRHSMGCWLLLIAATIAALVALVVVAF